MLYAIHQNVKLEVIDAITVCLEGGGLEENRVKGLLYYVWEFFCSLNGQRGINGLFYYVWKFFCSLNGERWVKGLFYYVWKFFVL